MMYNNMLYTLYKHVYHISMGIYLMVMIALFLISNCDMIIIHVYIINNHKIGVPMVSKTTLISVYVCVC